MNKSKIDHLEVFSKSKKKMAEGQPNIREWDTVDHTGQKIGTVYDTLFDTKSNVIRYVIVNLKNGKLLNEDRLVLMPVGRARINDTKDEVVFPNITKEQLSKLPDFLTIEHLKEEDEYSVRNAFRSPGESAASPDNTDRSSFYDHEIFSTDNFHRGSYIADDSQGKMTSGKKVEKGPEENRTTNSGSNRGMESSANRNDDDVNVHPDASKRSTQSSNTRTGSDLNKNSK